MFAWSENEQDRLRPKSAGKNPNEQKICKFLQTSADFEYTKSCFSAV